MKLLKPLPFTKAPLSCVKIYESVYGPRKTDKTISVDILSRDSLKLLEGQYNVYLQALASKDSEALFKVCEPTFAEKTKTTFSDYSLELNTPKTVTTQAKEVLRREHYIRPKYLPLRS